MQSCKNTYFPLTMSIHNIRYRESYDIKFRKIFIRLHIHGQTCKLIIVFPIILIKIAIYENQTTQLYFNCSHYKMFRVFWKLYNFKKKNIYIGCPFKQNYILETFFLSSTLWKGKEGQRRGETSIFENLQWSPTPHTMLFYWGKNKKTAFSHKWFFFFFFLRRKENLKKHTIKN